MSENRRWGIFLTHTVELVDVTGRGLEISPQLLLTAFCFHLLQRVEDTADEIVLGQPVVIEHV